MNWLGLIKRGWVSAAVFGVGLTASSVAAAEVYSYVDWTEANVAAGTAEGVIVLPDDSEVTVTFAAINPDGSPGNLYGAQVDDGLTDYWEPSDPFISDEVENRPPSTDILQLSGGDDQVYEVTLSEPIKDPIMAIVSLGSGGIPITYDFDSPFEIVSQGTGYWGGTDMTLEARDGDVLYGAEGHGTIKFLGTFETFSWTVPSPESWHGFTFAIRTTERLEPTMVDASTDDAPDMEAGDAGVGAVDAGTDDVDDADDDDGTDGTGEPDDTDDDSSEPDSEPDDTDSSDDDDSDDGDDTDDDGSASDDDDAGESDGSSSCSCSLVGETSGRGFGAFALLTLGALALRRRR